MLTSSLLLLNFHVDSILATEVNVYTVPIVVYIARFLIREINVDKVLIAEMNIFSPYCNNVDTIPVGEINVDTASGSSVKCYNPC